MLKVKDRKRRVYICFMKTPVTKVKKKLETFTKDTFLQNNSLKVCKKGGELFFATFC